MIMPYHIAISNPWTSGYLVSTSDGGYIVRLEWSPPLDDGGASITSYHIFVDQVYMENATTTAVANIELDSTGEYVIGALPPVCGKR